MPKKNSPSFVLTLPLYANTVQQIQLENVFEQCRCTYNAMLNETVKRLQTLQQSKVYQKNLRCILGIGKKMKALQMKLSAKEDKMLKTQLQHLVKERETLYKEQNEIQRQFGYTEFQLHEEVKKYSHYFKRVDSATAQKLATRAFQAVEKLRFGKAKQVRFIRRHELDSIEAKSNKACITFRIKENQPVVNIQGMSINVKIFKRDVYAQMALMQNKIKYCRIIRNMVRGKNKYSVQLVMEGCPSTKNRRLGTGKVGIDPSLQYMAVASDQKAAMMPLAPLLDRQEREIYLLKRQMDRSRRANNPHKFNEDGTINRQNKDKWVNSQSYSKKQSQLQELYRRQRELRKTSHEQLVNEVLSLGDTFYIEKNSFKAFQKRKKKTTKRKGRYQSKKRFGKSIANRAPSMFLKILKRKCQLLGGTYHEMDAHKAKLSQYDHKSDTYTKKKLSQREHIFADGTKVQRDLYSAFLARCINVNTHQVNREECLQQFAMFKSNHDEFLQVS